MTGSDRTQTTDASIDADAIDEGVDVEKAQRGARLLLEAIGEDPNRPDLADTWRRRVPDAAATLTEGYRESEKPTMRTFESDADDLVIKTGIPVYSLCEHHLLPYTGEAHLAYRPEGEVVGLSKLTRYLRWQSRRLTTQEELTRDVARGLAEEIGSGAVLVEIRATHLCEAMRGIETPTDTRTRSTAGSPTEHERDRFREAVDRAEGGR